MSDSRVRKLAKQDKNFFTKQFRRRKTVEEVVEDTIAEWGGQPRKKKKFRKRVRKAPE